MGRRAERWATGRATGRRRTERWATGRRRTYRTRPRLPRPGTIRPGWARGWWAALKRRRLMGRGAVGWTGLVRRAGLVRPWGRWRWRGRVRLRLTETEAGARPGEARPGGARVRPLPGRLAGAGVPAGAGAVTAGLGAGVPAGAGGAVAAGLGAGVPAGAGAGGAVLVWAVLVWAVLAWAEPAALWPGPAAGLAAAGAAALGARLPVAGVVFGLASLVAQGSLSQFPRARPGATIRTAVSWRGASAGRRGCLPPGCRARQGRPAAGRTRPIARPRAQRPAAPEGLSGRGSALPEPAA